MAFPKIKFVYQKEKKQTQSPICPVCNNERELRTRKPKLLSYLLFVGNFIIFFWITSNYKLETKMSILCVAIQVILGAWAMSDRIKNNKPLFYCRRCESRLPS